MGSKAMDGPQDNMRAIATAKGPGVRKGATTCVSTADKPHGGEHHQATVRTGMGAGKGHGPRQAGSGTQTESNGQGQHSHCEARRTKKRGCDDHHHHGRNTAEHLQDGTDGNNAFDAEAVAQHAGHVGNDDIENDERHLHHHEARGGMAEIGHQQIGPTP